MVRTCNAIYPDDIGGPGIHCFELSLRQTANRMKVSVIVPRKSADLPFHERVVDSFEIFRLPSPWQPWSVLGMTNPYLPTLPAIVSGLRPSLVHAHSHLFLMNFQAIIAARRLGIPSIVTVHGVFAQRDLFTNLVQFGYISTFSSWMMAQSSRIICLTHSDAALIRRFGVDQDKIRIIPNGINTDLFKPGTEDEGNILWVGRFVPEKGLGTLVEAARIVCREKSLVKFTLIGEGPLKDNIISLVRKSGLTDKVRILPRMSQPEVAKMMASCELFAFPSVREGFPKTVLEAMSCGKPIVASDLPCLNEAFDHEHAGILVPRQNAQEFAKATMELLEDKGLRRKLGDRGRHLALAKYNWSVIAKQIENVYAEALVTGPQSSKTALH